jgi:hypothetical protein
MGPTPYFVAFSEVKSDANARSVARIPFDFSGARLTVFPPPDTART